MNSTAMSINSTNVSIHSMNGFDIIMQDKFIAYALLEPFDINTNYVLLLREVSNGVLNPVNDKEQLSIILQLRRMRRYQQALFDVAFDNIISVFVDKYLIQPSHTSLVLCHSLLFVNEIFSTYILSFNDDWLKQLYPPIEDTVFCSNSQMSQIARVVIHSFAINMKYTSALVVLFKAVEDINGSETREKFLYETFETFFKSIDETNILYGFDWNYIIAKLNLAVPRDFNVIQNIFLILRRILDNNSWGQFFKMLKEKNRNVVNKIINSN